MTDSMWASVWEWNGPPRFLCSLLNLPPPPSSLLPPTTAAQEANHTRAFSVTEVRSWTPNYCCSINPSQSRLRAFEDLWTCFLLSRKKKKKHFKHKWLNVKESKEKSKDNPADVNGSQHCQSTHVAGSDLHWQMQKAANQTQAES